MWYLGRAPLSAEAMQLLARTHATFVRAVSGIPRKCLVLDLDNTLWGGVVGEEGISGIKLGQSYPGSAYCDLQRAILLLSQRGVVLAINSKNNPQDVEEVFRAHPDMVLKSEHIASRRINWQPKPDNMLEIADELNIGLDSLVFLDDNPAECDLMRRSLPQVMTLEACDAKGNPDPLGSLRLLLDGGVFDKLSFTAEDRRRGAQYQQQAARRRSERSATSLEDFLRGLEMTASVCEVDEFAFPRVLDLIHKTNQFNLTTRRHSATRLEQMIDDPQWGAFSLRVRDRFGDNGIIGAAILRLEGDLGTLDTFLLSCRVIGRNVETAFLRYLADWARRRGANRIEGEFVPTRKNTPAADFYRRHGFEEVSGPDNGNGNRWRLRLDEIGFQWPEYIQRACDNPNVAYS
jgi:FkbH-like protein